MKITKQRLNEMYMQMTTRDMMKQLGGISVATLYRLLDEAGIKRKRQNVAPRRKINIQIIE